MKVFSQFNILILITECPVQTFYLLHIYSLMLSERLIWRLSSPLVIAGRSRRDGQHPEKLQTDLARY